MNSKLINRLPYIISIVFQGIFLLATTINLLVDLICSSSKIWSLSIAHIFIPYLKYIKSGQIFDLIILSVFLCISIAFFILSSKELLDSKNKKSPFLILNYGWNILGYWTFATKINGAYVMDMFSMIYYYLFIICILTIIPLKWKEQKNLHTINNDNSENPLLKKFDLLPKSYEQIVRTAKGATVVEICLFFILLFFKYIGETIPAIINALYFFVTVFAIIIFFGTISDYRFFEKSGNKSNGKWTLAKLNIMQITSFVLFIPTYFIFIN